MHVSKSRRTFASLLKGSPPPKEFGKVVEWSITAVLKTAVLRGTGGSNPSLSATERDEQFVRRAFFVFLCFILLNASTKFFFFFRNSPKCWLYIIGLHEVSVILNAVKNDRDCIIYNSVFGLPLFHAACSIGRYSWLRWPTQLTVSSITASCVKKGNSDTGRRIISSSLSHSRAVRRDRSRCRGMWWELYQLLRLLPHG